MKFWVKLKILKMMDINLPHVTVYKIFNLYCVQLWNVIVLNSSHPLRSRRNSNHHSHIMWIVDLSPPYFHITQRIPFLSQSPLGATHASQGLSQHVCAAPKKGEMWVVLLRGCRHEGHAGKSDVKISVLQGKACGGTTSRIYGRDK